MNIITVKSNLPTVSAENADTTTSGNGADIFSEVIQQAGMQQATKEHEIKPTDNKTGSPELDKADLEKVSGHEKKDGKKIQKKNLHAEELLNQTQILAEKMLTTQPLNVITVKPATTVKTNSVNVNDSSDLEPSLVTQKQAGVVSADLAKTIMEAATLKQNVTDNNALNADGFIPQTETTDLASMINNNKMNPKLDVNKTSSSNIQDINKQMFHPSNVNQPAKQNAQLPLQDINSSQTNAIQNAHPQADLQAKMPEDNSSQNKAETVLTGLANVLQNQVTQAISNPAAFLTSDVHAAHTNNDTFNVATNTLNLVNNQYEPDANWQDTSATQLKDAYVANIKIYPPELGNVLAKLKMDKNNAQLVILTENDRVRDIVAASLPQLKEHFLQGNLNLTHIQVQTSAGGNDQNMGKQSRSGEVINDPNLNEDKVQPQVSKQQPKPSDKIVDTYV